jgi:hypothetical protein
MNRDIKFRAWDDGVMIYSDSFNSDQHSDYAYLSKFFESIREDAIIMQFTQMADRSGKDIYEGDILTFDCDEPRFNYPCFEVVLYRHGNYVGLGIDKEKNLFAAPFRLPYCLILGNIYENPELLTPKTADNG